MEPYSTPLFSELTELRSAGKRALTTPELGLDLLPDDKRAIAEAARLIAALDIDDPVESHRRDQALSFLTEAPGDITSPWWKEGQTAIHVHRNDQQVAYGMEMVRLDEQQLTAQQTRIRWRQIHEQDGRHRMAGFSTMSRINKAALDLDGLAMNPEALAQTVDLQQTAAELLDGNERYRRIAAWALEADAAGLSRNRYVAEKEMVSKNYARQLIYRARKGGYLT